jgi:ferric-dicitrate binding protein FerR (iron transport regulator)
MHYAAESIIRLSLFERGEPMKFLTMKLARFLAVLLLAVPLHGAWAAEAGRITVVEGKADIVRAGAGPAVAAKVGDAVNEKDVLRTKRQSRLEVKMTDGSQLKLSELTQIEVSKYAPGGDQPDGLISATRGQVRAIVTETFAKRKESFRVKTPTALVGVQGTNFAVLMLANLTQIMVYEGVVSAKNVLAEVAGQVILTAGQMTKVYANQAPETPQDIGAADGGDGFKDPTLLPTTPTPLEGGIPGLTPPKK